MSSATRRASASVVPRNGPIHVAVSRTYSTWSSAWRVPLMNVTAERSGHSPCAATTSSAPRPFWIVITVALGRRPSSVAASGSRSVPLHARIASSVSSGRRNGSAVAASSAVKSERPETRRPFSRSAVACSSRRVSTVTSATWARCPARSEPIAPAPATTTFITPAAESNAPGASARARPSGRRAGR